MKKSKSENVPKEMRDIYTAIVKLTDGFAKRQLNEEYALHPGRNIKPPCPACYQ